MAHRISRLFTMTGAARRHQFAATCFASLAFFAGTAAFAADARLAPSPTADTILSPSGPYIEGLEATPNQANAPTRPSGAGTFAYTYLRCWYRLDADPLKPMAGYEWALDPASGDWYRMAGYWGADGVMQWRDIFYSTTTQATLNEVCTKTLAAHGIAQPVLQTSAANNQLSLNHTVWSQDSADQGERLNRIVVLGDSLSDTQNIYNASLWHMPNRESWTAGRFSNGPLWVEHLSDLLKLPMYNWAVGGAAADQHLVLPGVSQQVDAWKQQMSLAQNYRADNTLFLMLIGANDLISVGRTAVQSASTVRESLVKLVDAGARHIVLLNLPDVTRTPSFRMRNDGAAIAVQVTIYNRLLSEIAEELRSRYGAALRLELFDTHALFNELLDNPEPYGIDNTTDACLDIRTPSVLVYLSPHAPAPACSDPERYLFWDALHPTMKTHRLLAQKLAAYLQSRYADRLLR